MRNRNSLLALMGMAFAILCNHLPGLAQVEPVPEVTGYITKITSSTSFEVNAIPVVCSDRTQNQIEDLSILNGPWQVGPYLGQQVKVFGKKDGKRHLIVASLIVIKAEDTASHEGSGVVDRILSPPSGQERQIIVRADGYAILIDGKTKLRLAPPLTSLADISTNVWIEFKAKRQLDGHIVATEAAFFSNAVNEREGKLRQKNEFDPSAVKPADRQSKTSKAFLGTKVKKIPPYSDPVLQARIERIGSSLIPEYQRVLQASDPTKIDFRFSLVQIKANAVLAMPSGIILVSRAAVERLSNDAQLAEILAYAMAFILEKREYRDQSTKRMLTAASWAGLAAPSLAAPSFGIATYAAMSVLERHEREQSGRVSLALMQDAHYDIFQAPVAWWILASKKPKDLAKIAMPDLSGYLYRTLGATWRTGQMAIP